MLLIKALIKGSVTPEFTLELKEGEKAIHS